MLNCTLQTIYDSDMLSEAYKTLTHMDFLYFRKYITFCLLSYFEYERQQSTIQSCSCLYTRTFLRFYDGGLLYVDAFLHSLNSVTISK